MGKHLTALIFADSIEIHSDSAAAIVEVGKEAAVPLCCDPASEPVEFLPDPGCVHVDDDDRLFGFAAWMSQKGLHDAIVGLNLKMLLDQDWVSRCARALFRMVYETTDAIDVRRFSLPVLQKPQLFSRIPTVKNPTLVECPVVRADPARIETIWR